MSGSASISCVINGDARELPDGLTLVQLIEHFQLTPRQVLIEYNGEALPRDAWPSQEVVAGDRIEIVRMVAGG